VVAVFRTRLCFSSANTKWCSARIMWKPIQMVAITFLAEWRSFLISGQVPISGRA
jgi:hypothetical protein